MTLAAAPTMAGDPALLEAAARRLSTDGAQLRASADLLGSTTSALAADGWHGAAAAAFTGAAEQVAAVGARAAALLERVQLALAGHAAALEAAELDRARQLAAGLPGETASAVLATAQARMQAVLREAAHEAELLRRHLDAAAPAVSHPATPAPAPVVAPVQPAPAGEVVLTLGVLAALLGAPTDPTAAGALPAPVRATLSRPLRYLLGEEAPGWHRSLAVAGQGLRPDAPVAAAFAPRGRVAGAVATVLRPDGADGTDGAGAGWRLPDRG